MSVATAPAVVAFAPRNPAFRADPYPIYAALRAEGPVHRRPLQGDWLLVRHADIAAALRDERFVRGAGRHPPIEPDDPSVPLPRLTRLRREAHRIHRLWLTVRNPPEHTRVRRALHQLFTPHQAETLRARVEARTNALLAAALDRGRFDVIKDLAYPLAVAVLVDWLEVPEEDRERVDPWIPHLVIGNDVDVGAIGQERGLIAISALTTIFESVIDRRRRHPAAQPGLLSHMMAAQDSGQLDVDDVLAQCLLMLFAGHSTTQHLIGNSMLALLRHPEQYERLRAQPELLPLAIEEFLRYDSPVQFISRTTAAAVELHGTTIPPGSIVHLIISSANRDPTAFPEPDRLDISRRPDSYLSFGRGIHYCIGRHVSKLIAEVALRALITNVGPLVLNTETLHWEETYLVHGVTSLPVRVDDTLLA